MEKTVLIVIGDRKEGEQLCRLMAQWRYHAACFANLEALAEALGPDSSAIVLFDLDSVRVNNQALRHLWATYASIRLLGASSRHFHPELKEAICNYFYACLHKPMDPDELLYWLEILFKSNEKGGRAPP